VRDLSCSIFALVPLEILDIAFVLLCFLKRVEGDQVAAFARGSIFLAGIEAE
jgi:hypothetical protein